MRIVIPRALHYFYFFPHWEAFLGALGHEVVTTPPTDRELLGRGVRLALSDVCLPLKGFLGHAEAAQALGDAVFVPRLVSVVPTRYYCPKFLALPDMVRAKFPETDVRTVEINAKKGKDFTRKAFLDLAVRLGSPRSRGKEAWDAAERAAREGAASGFPGGVPRRSGAPKGPRIGLVGHPYTVWDGALSSGIRSWLEKQGMAVTTADELPGEVLERVAWDLYRDVYWECASTLTRAAIHFLGRRDFGGMIHLSAFGCGPDSFVGDLVGRRARRDGTLPFVRLLVDEHTAREGLLTRLEAFLDMVHAFRRKGTW